MYSGFIDFDVCFSCGLGRYWNRLWFDFNSLTLILSRSPVMALFRCTLDATQAHVIERSYEI